MDNIYLKADMSTFKKIVEFANINSVGIEYLMSFDDYKSLQFLKHSGIKYTIHSVFFDVELGSLNPYVRNESKKILRDVIAMCNELSPENLVIHHNYNPYKYAFKEDSFVERFVDTFLDVIDGKNSYPISFENVFEFDSNIGLKIVDKIGRDDIGLCFDCGHFNMFSEEYIHSWIQKWSKKLFSFHLHNNYGKYDEHNVLPDGSFDIYELKDYFANRILTIENKTISEFEVSLRYLKEIIG
ncbi:sugar phosphate isomerase/epimerase [Deferribacteraceae bacterium V6Fe1]|nr:sugar phosphate isomerase/epimerase [Deferribacteraceae bacterium V6Fe1]